MHDTRGVPQPLPSGAWTHNSGAIRSVLKSLAAVAVFMAVLTGAYLFAIRGDGTPKARPFVVGLESVLRSDIPEKGPQYEPDVTNLTRGMWIDMVDDEIVIFSAETFPGSRCDISWKRVRYVESCGDSPLKKSEMVQFKYRVLESGPEAGGVEVNTTDIIRP